MAQYNERGMPIVQLSRGQAQVEGVTFYTVPVKKNVRAAAHLRSARFLNGGVTKALRAGRMPKELTKVIGVLSVLPAPVTVFDKIVGGGIYPGWVDALGNVRYYQKEVVEYYFSAPLFEDEYYDAPKKSLSAQACIYFQGQWYGAMDKRKEEGHGNGEAMERAIGTKPAGVGSSASNGIGRQDSDAEEGEIVIGGPPFTQAEYTEGGSRADEVRSVGVEEAESSEGAEIGRDGRNRLSGRKRIRSTSLTSREGSQSN